MSASHIFCLILILGLNLFLLKKYKENLKLFLVMICEIYLSCEMFILQKISLNEIYILNIFLGLLIGFLLFYNDSLKKKMNEKIEKQNKHLKSLNQTIMSFEMIAEKKKEKVKDLKGKIGILFTKVDDFLNEVLSVNQQEEVD